MLEVQCRTVYLNDVYLNLSPQHLKDRDEILCRYRTISSPNLKIKATNLRSDGCTLLEAPSPLKVGDRILLKFEGLAVFSATVDSYINERREAEISFERSLHPAVLERLVTFLGPFA